MSFMDVTVDKYILLILVILCIILCCLCKMMSNSRSNDYRIQTINRRLSHDRILIEEQQNMRALNEYFKSINNGFTLDDQDDIVIIIGPNKNNIKLGKKITDFIPIIP